MEKTLSRQDLSSFGVTALQVFLGSLCIALFAQIEIPLPFSHVPFTGQTVAVMGVGAFLGGKKGGAAALLYLGEGAIGWPVFAGGAGGFIHFLGATGGYLLTYPAMSYFVGKSLENKVLKAWVKLCLMAYLSILQLSTGSLWLAYFVGLKEAYLQGFFPFVLLEFSKIGMVWAFIRKGRS